MPNGITGGYDTDDTDFAGQMAAFNALGVKIVGGCCGPTPEYIKALVAAYGTLKPVARTVRTEELICTPLQVEDTSGLTAAGSRKRFADAEEIIEDALEQADDGARILEVALEGQSGPAAADIVRGIQSQCEKPLYFVSGDAEALGAALRALSGTAAVSAACAGSRLIDLAAKYGVVIIR
jgi:5-methyltetrahydrofolate--homocysteine methyltransferase